MVEYSRPKCTDSLVREVNFSLRYFEDAVVKATYEMLPGCATVVLETVVNLQNYTVTKVSVIASRYRSFMLSYVHVVPVSFSSRTTAAQPGSIS